MAEGATKETKPRARPRGFDVILSEVADGAALRETSEELAKIARAVQAAHEARGKATGELTLKVKLTMGKNRVIDVAYDVTAKMPKPVRETGAMWVDKSGNLVPSDPLQLSLPPARDVPTEQAVREAVMGRDDAGAPAKEV